jgi:hypothetical protein
MARTPNTSTTPSVPPSPVGLGRLPLDPLPAEFDADLRALDGLLAAAAASSPVPRRLADLVYDASVGLLVPRRTFRIETFRQTVWSRLAMAASLGLAFVLAAGALRRPSPAEGAAMLTAGPVQLLMESEGQSFDYLLDTRDLTYDELNADLYRILEQVEM